MKLKGKRDNAWNIPRIISFFPQHFMLYRGKSTTFGTVYLMTRFPTCYSVIIILICCLVNKILLGFSLGVNIILFYYINEHKSLWLLHCEQYFCVAIWLYRIPSFVMIIVLLEFRSWFLIPSSIGFEFLQLLLSIQYAFQYCGSVEYESIEFPKIQPYKIHKLKMLLYSKYKNILCRRREKIICLNS